MRGGEGEGNRLKAEQHARFQRAAKAWSFSATPVEAWVRSTTVVVFSAGKSVSVPRTGWKLAFAQSTKTVAGIFPTVN